MIANVSITTLIVIVFLLAAFLIILRRFSLPKNFYENQTKREGLLKEKIRSSSLETHNEENEQEESSEQEE